jgi:hypothetical protein
MTNASGSAKSRFPYVRKRPEKNGEAMKAHVLVAAASATAALLITPGLAHADNWGSYNDHSGAAYAAELGAEDVYLDATSAASLANEICAERARGVTEDDAIRAYYATDPRDSANAAIAVVVGAERHFCGSYYGTNPKRSY